MGRYTAYQKMRQFIQLGCVGGATFATICLYTGNEKFYRGLMNRLHWLDPETAHNLSVFALKHRLTFRCKLPVESPVMSSTVFGREFYNPVGMAAGFDKQAEAIMGLKDIGFGFVEIGSVTPEPQAGNPRPRVFRLPEDNAVINRYGFNSDGHEVVFERIRDLRAKHGSDSQQLGIVLGVNLGKNKTSSTPVNDYVLGVEKFASLADYLVINVSSPNTPGLRKMQGKEELSHLIGELLRKRNQVKPELPLLVKIAPDLSEQDKMDIANVVTASDTRVDGLIVTNTTISRPESLTSAAKSETGGLSGQPLRNLSTQTIHDIYELTKGSIPIIGVGGVSCGQDAFDKIAAGASLVQLYTAIVYQGPPVVTKIRRELEEILTAKNYKNISQAVGCAHRKE